jgi:ketosteroid isomerase-like protein
MRDRHAALFLAAMLASAPSLASAAGTGQESQTAHAALDQVITVERAFAADSLQMGVKRSFLKYAATDGVIFRPQPVPAVATIEKDPDDDKGATLDWWPSMGAIASSGDLALSVGPWVIRDPNGAAPEQKEVYGYYATVWRKQPDGSWKFVIDGAGARLAAAPTRAKGSDVVRMPVSTLTARDGLDEARKAEDRLASNAQSDARAAIAAAAAEDGWLMESNVEPALALEANAAELKRRPARLKLSYAGGGASRAGDLAYTYGLVESADDKIPLKDATYLHVWQKRADGWRLIFEGIKSRR